MNTDNDPCEMCGVADGITVESGLYVCGKCAKKMKKQKRKERPNGS